MTPLVSRNMQHPTPKTNRRSTHTSTAVHTVRHQLDVFIIGSDGDAFRIVFVVVVREWAFLK